MPRWLERLVACVALTAFLAANSTTAVQALSGRTCSCHPAPPPSHDKHDSRDGCADCDGGGHSPDGAFAAHGPAHAPAGEGCPCPGGCGYCSVAKVPCPHAVAPTLDGDLLPGQRAADGSLCYAPPVGGPSTPPPRS